MTIFSFFIVLAFMICIFLAWFFSHRAKHKEKMMMIEKGLADEKTKEAGNFRFPWLKVGIVILGLGTGLLVISGLSASGWLETGGNALPLAVLIVCGGISMIVANYINRGDRKP